MQRIEVPLVSQCHQEASMFEQWYIFMFIFIKGNIIQLRSGVITVCLESEGSSRWFINMEINSLCSNISPIDFLGCMWCLGRGEATCDTSLQWKWQLLGVKTGFYETTWNGGGNSCAFRRPQKLWSFWIAFCIFCNCYWEKKFVVSILYNNGYQTVVPKTLRSGPLSLRKIL